jgi:pentatricopeptide repeat protein
MKHIRREPIQGGLTTNKGGHCNNQRLEESFSFFVMMIEESFFF